MAVRIVFGVDIEPVPRLVDAPGDSHWNGFGASLEAIREVRERRAT